MVAVVVSGAAVAVSPRGYSAGGLIPGEENQASSSLPSVSHFFGQRCSGFLFRSDLRRRRKDSATAGAWAYATDSEHIRENFSSGTGNLGNNINCKNLYDCLGVSKFATPEQIKAAYRSKALQVHPDVVPEDQKEEATKTFLEIKMAYSVLSDHQQRAAYDMKIRFRDTGPVSVTPSQWGFIAVDDASGSISFRGRKNYESDFFS